MSCHSRPCHSSPCYTTTTVTSCSARPAYSSTSAYPAYTGSATSLPIRTNGALYLRQKALKEGYLVKQGGIIKNWKRRFWVLSGMTLYYFVSPSSEEPQGSIQLKGASVALNNGTFPYSSQAKYVFAVDTPSRRYYVEADNQLEFDSWVEAIQNAIRGKVTQFYSQPVPNLQQQQQQQQAPPMAPTAVTAYPPAGGWAQPSAPPAEWSTPQAGQAGYRPLYPPPLQQQQQPQPQPQQYWAQPPPPQPQQQQQQNAYAGFGAPYGGVVQMSSGYSTNAYPYTAQHQ